MGKTKKRHMLGVFPAALTILSSIIGGGIVGIPFAYWEAGIIASIFLNIFTAFLTFVTCYLYLLSKDLTGFENFTEIGYAVWGRISIFLINTSYLITSFGSLMIYLIIFGNDLSSLI